MEKHLKFIKSKISSIEKQLKNAPPGKLICTKNGKYTKWYISNSRKITYLPKKNILLAQRLATKRYLLAQLKELNKELRATNLYLKYRSKDIYALSELYNEKHKLYEIISSSPSVKNNELLKWSSEYEQDLSFMSENLKHKSPSGHILRSKSELLIDIALTEKNIPFRYESPLFLGGKKIIPDFTLRHPVYGDYYYWEHFGMMDNPDYYDAAIDKLNLYISNGIYPMQNLIITFETSDSSLDLNQINRLIDYYFG